MDSAQFDKDLVQQGLCHSEQMARTFYLRSDKTAVAAKATEIIAICTIGKATKASIKEKETQKSTKQSDTAEMSTTEIPEDTPSTAQDNSTEQTLTEPEKSQTEKLHKDLIQSEETAPPPCRSKMPKATTEIPEDTPSMAKKHGKKRPLTEPEKSQIQSVFKDLIQSHEMVTLKTEQYGAKTLLGICGIDVKVADRVRASQAKFKAPDCNLDMNVLKKRLLCK